MVLQHLLVIFLDFRGQLEGAGVVLPVIEESGQDGAAIRSLAKDHGWGYFLVNGLKCTNVSVFMCSFSLPLSMKWFFVMRLVCAGTELIWEEYNYKSRLRGKRSQ